jgi:hypothetical protein
MPTGTAPIPNRQLTGLSETELEQFHQELTIVDLHAHPSLKVSLWNRSLAARHRAHRHFDPLGIRTDLPKTPRRRRRRSPVLRVRTRARNGRGMRLPAHLPLSDADDLSGTLPEPHFGVATAAMDRIQQEVEAARDATPADPPAEVIKSVQDLDDLLSQDDPRPTAIVHSVEGAHSLDSRQPKRRGQAHPDEAQDLDVSIGNLQALFSRGVALLTLAHFYPNDFVGPVFPTPRAFRSSAASPAVVT